MLAPPGWGTLSPSCPVWAGRAWIVTAIIARLPSASGQVAYWRR